MRKNTPVLAAAIFVMIIAVIAIAMADSRDNLLKKVSELEKSNQECLAEKSSIQEENSNLTEKLSDQKQKISRLNYLIFQRVELVKKVMPYLLEIWERTKEGCYCTGISPWLEKNRGGIYALYLQARKKIPDMEVEVKPIDITFPDGGETLEGGSKYMITWKSEMSGGLVRIEFYNGSSWHAVIEKTENNGKYEWCVPNGFSTRKGRIYIEDITPLRVRHVDYSGDNFTVTETYNE